MAPGQTQAEIFEAAKQSVAEELNEEMLSWDFSQMLSRLRDVIANRNQQINSNGIRFFCRHYLGMHGDSHNEMRRWISGEAVMPFERIQLVLRVLKSERDGNLVLVLPDKGGRRVHQVKKSVNSGSAEEMREPKPEPSAPKTSGIIRKLVDHATTLFNSLMILIVEAGITSDDLFDGDRIQIRMALKQICVAFGIAVIFPESEAARSQPVTRQDFADIGLRTQTERRKRRS
jgi:hypothetical protein